MFVINNMSAGSAFFRPVYQSGSNTGGTVEIILAR